MSYLVHVLHVEGILCIENRVFENRYINILLMFEHRSSYNLYSNIGTRNLFVCVEFSLFLHVIVVHRYI